MYGSSILLCRVSQRFGDMGVVLRFIVFELFRHMPKRGLGCTELSQGGLVSLGPEEFWDHGAEFLSDLSLGGSWYH